MLQKGNPLGIAGFAGMSLYEIDSWSMVRTIIVHFSAISAVPYLSASSITSSSMAVPNFRMSCSRMDSMHW